MPRISTTPGLVSIHKRKGNNNAYNCSLGLTTVNSLGITDFEKERISVYFEDDKVFIKKAPRYENIENHRKYKLFKPPRKFILHFSFTLNFYLENGFYTIKEGKDLIFELTR
jgi:hypothetical protein